MYIFHYNLHTNLEPITATASQIYLARTESRRWALRFEAATLYLHRSNVHHREMRKGSWTENLKERDLLVGLGVAGRIVQSIVHKSAAREFELICLGLQWTHNDLHNLCAFQWIWTKNPRLSCFIAINCCPLALYTILYRSLYKLCPIHNTPRYFVFGVQLGLFSQANSTLPRVREQDGEENIWTLKTGPNKKMTKITGLQNGDKLQRFVLYTTPASENQIKCKRRDT